MERQTRLAARGETSEAPVTVNAVVSAHTWQLWYPRSRILSGLAALAAAAAAAQQAAQASL